MRNKWLFTAFILLPAFGLTQKKAGELTLMYNAVISSAKDAGKKISSTKAYYLKGFESRADETNAMYSSVTIYDFKTGSGVILKEVNGQKLLIRMNQENWNQKNKRFSNLIFTKTTETKTIAGYNCSRANASTPDGFDIAVYYTRDLLPENKSYDPLFKNLDGLPLEYELNKGDLQIKYTLVSISLNPVPASKFDIPTSGYRELTFEESLKLNNQ